MKTIVVCKAEPIGDEVVESVILEITGKIPTWRKEDWQECYEHFYKAQASAIMQALEVLPQGTRHQLLIKMLQDKLCLFNVK